jgi:hypothetical protein
MSRGVVFMRLKVFVGVLLGVLVVGAWWICFQYAQPVWSAPAIDYQRFGVFGDSFGVLNALFSGLALIGVAFAIILQAHDSKRQREDAQMHARIAAFAAIIEAEKTLSEYYLKAIHDGASIPIPEHTTITWLDMVENSRRRILDMSAALEVERKKLMGEKE